MKIKPLTKSRSLHKGITLIEILLIISLLAVLVSFAIPSIGGAAARAEMTAAVENVQFSIDAARDVARMTGSDISVNLESSLNDQVQVITFSSTKRGRTDPTGGLQDYRLPDDIQMLSNHEVFVFNGRGLAESPGEIILVSKIDESITSTLQVE
jgi:Tfp pilus assembly protein FimT